MPRREEIVTGEYYHVYNRGVAKQDIFHTPRHYNHFESTLKYYLPLNQQRKFSDHLRLCANTQVSCWKQRVDNEIFQVDIIAYCLMSNHFHFLLRQTADNGISNFMRMIGNSYTHYFNTVTHRVGPLFQGRYQLVHIESGEQLIHGSRYIHINPVIAGIVSMQEIETYPYSSYSQYVRGIPSNYLLVNPESVLSFFSKKFSYQQFCLDQVNYAITLFRNKQILLDMEM